MKQFIFIFIFLIGIVFILTENKAKAQFSQGTFSLSAAVGMPSGLAADVAIPGQAKNGINLTYGNSVAVGYVLSPSLEVGAGFGYISYNTESDGNSNDLSALSFAAQGKYFLNHNTNVMPFLGAGLSFSSLPTVKSGTVETSGSLLVFGAYFGGQAFLNSSKTVALFIQIGLGYNTLNFTTENGDMSSETTNTTLNLGGSAIGASIYL